MQADGKGWLFAPAGLLDGPLPAHYEPAESPVRNPFYRQQANPTREVFPRKDNLQNPSPPEPASDVFPYVFTTYRLTEHHTAGGMSRWLPYLSELQPEFFCEVSPELARERRLEHLGWATIVTARTAIEARVLVTDRMVPLRVGGRIVHQVGLPYHWGVGGSRSVTGDSANDLFGVTLDPNVHIQESKVASCDIQPGRRPTGPALLRFVEEYRSRAGITVETGNRQRTAGGLSEPVSAARIRTSRPSAGWSDAPAAQGLLHRHVDLHRLQGVRGRVQGVERRPRRRVQPARLVLRQHRRARRLDLAARRVHRAAAPLAGETGLDDTDRAAGHRRAERRRRRGAVGDRSARHRHHKVSLGMPTSRCRPTASSAPTSAG